MIVTLDLSRTDLHWTLDALRKYGEVGTARAAEQIEAQASPGKPKEPTGMGAVVIDTDGIAWVRADKDEAPWVSPINWWSAYDDVDAVEVKSPGVQL